MAKKYTAAQRAKARKKVSNMGVLKYKKDIQSALPKPKPTKPVRKKKK